MTGFSVVAALKKCINKLSYKIMISFGAHCKLNYEKFNMNSLCELLLISVPLDFADCTCLYLSMHGVIIMLYITKSCAKMMNIIHDTMMLNTTNQSSLGGYHSKT